MKPLLITVVHTEEAFDWSEDFNSQNRDVSHIKQIETIHRVFEKNGISPTYAVDFPVIDDKNSLKHIRKICNAGVDVEIAAHLHPWVCPPEVEEINPSNSFPGNLPYDLEKAKLQNLTEAIVSGIGKRPMTYLAGRYGVGPNTYDILRELGYQVDLSPSPGYDYSSVGGPDFSTYPRNPYYEKGILVVPHSTANIGWMTGKAEVLNFFRHPFTRIFKRLPCSVSLVRLSPEGFSLENMKDAAKALIDGGHKVLVLSFHSPSIKPGNTPYVMSEGDLVSFVEKLNDFFKFFHNYFNGESVLPHELPARL